MVYGISTHSDQGGDGVLIASILAALLGHYIERQFGIAVTSTQTLFWILAGLLAVAGSRGLIAEEAGLPPESGSPGATSTGELHDPCTVAAADRCPYPLPDSHGSHHRSINGKISSYAFINALILVCLLYEFFHMETIRLPASSHLWSTSIFYQPATFFGALAMLLLTRAICSMTAACEISRCRRESGTIRGVMVLSALTGVASLGAALLFAITQMHMLGKIRALFESPRNPSFAALEGMTGIFDLFFFSLLLLMAWAGLSKVWRQGNGGRFFARPWGALLAVPLAWGAYAWIHFSNILPVHSDIMRKQAQSYLSLQRVDDAHSLLLRSVLLSPSDENSYIFLARGLMARFGNASWSSKGRFTEKTSLSEILALDPKLYGSLDGSDLMLAVQILLTHACELNPLFVDGINNLSRTCSVFANMPPVGPEERAVLAENTFRAYRQAIRISPFNVMLRNELAWLQFQYRGDFEGAMRMLEKSLALDSQFDETYLLMGDLHVTRRNWEEAASAYTKAISKKPDLAEAYDKLGFVREQQGRYYESIMANMDLLKVMANDPSVWNIHRNLAILYETTGNNEAALSHVELALEKAHDADKRELEEYRAHLSSRLTGIL